MERLSGGEPSGGAGRAAIEAGPLKRSTLTLTPTPCQPSRPEARCIGVQARRHLHVVADVDAHAGDNGDRDAREDLSQAIIAAGIVRTGIGGVAPGHVCEPPVPCMWQTARTLEGLYHTGIAPVRDKRVSQSSSGSMKKPYFLLR